METLGIVGLPNAGKSSLFHALTGVAVEIAPHPFTTTGSNVGVAAVPDPRLDVLAELSASAKVTHAGLEVVDIAGLAVGAAKGEGLGTQFLSQIREVDAILYCLRAFEDPAVPYSVEPPDPSVDLETLETELCLVDLEALESRLEKAHKAAMNTPAKKPVVVAMEKALVPLRDGIPLYRSGVSAEDLEALRDLFLLTDKPVLVVVNIGEADLGREGEIEDAVRKGAGEGTVVTAVCLALEAEAADVADPVERAELLASFGVAEPALPRVAAAAYEALGRLSFLTTGDKESRAWPIRRGWTARQAAGAIHSDLERRFIRAEVGDYEEIVAAGGWDAAKKANRVRTEGKDYVVRDGDVMVVLHGA